MRNLLLALALAASLPSIALADQDHGCAHKSKEHDEKKEHFIGKFDGFKKLELTKEQREVIAKASREQDKAKDKLTKQYLEKLSAADKAALQKERQAIHDEREKTILQTLTPEQQKQYAQHKEKAMAEKAEWEAFKKWKAEQQASSEKKS